MAAAAWTETATDITGDRDRWDDYLNVKGLADQIGLAPATIMDTLPLRTLQSDDPRSAIYRPAARIGQTRLAAIPMWDPAQAEAYNEIADGREDISQERAARRARLPVYTLLQAAEHGLASTKELAQAIGVAENVVRKWSRNDATFPPEVAVAERVAPHQYGPPRMLRSLVEVRAWVLAGNVRLSYEDRTRLKRDQKRDQERLAGSPAA